LAHRSGTAGNLDCMSVSVTRLPKLWRVSSHGRLCSTRGRISFGSREVGGIHTAHICGANYLVHRLVAFAHLRVPPTPLHNYVTHLDGNIANNHVSNLAYATPQDSNRLRAQRHVKISTSKAKPVLSQAPGEDSWTRHRSVQAAAEARGVSAPTVIRGCSHVRSRRSDLVFRYAPVEDLLGEEWRPAVHPLTQELIPITMVSSKGRVLHAGGTCTWGTKKERGYRYVQILYTTHLVHRLVLSSFSSALPCYVWEGNHIDGNRGNNALENLEFVTHSENMKHCMRNNPDRARRPVQGRKLCDAEWTMFDSLSQAADHVHCSVSGIWNVCHGRATNVKGWEFQYVSEYHHDDVEGELWADAVLELPSS